jgi:hypothetical protein
MQICCDAPVSQPRQALDQLFIRIENIVTGRLDIIEIGRENEIVVRVVRTVTGFLLSAEIWQRSSIHRCKQRPEGRCLKNYLYRSIFFSCHRL